MDNKYLVPLILFGVFLLLLGVEQVFPLRRRKRRLGPRFFVNLCCSAIALGAGATVVKTVAMFLSQWSAAHSVGLLFASPMPGPVRFALGFVLMDLSFYHWHRVNHRLGVLWRFHNVHHIDPDLDVSTSFRFHIVEILYSTVFRAVQVCVLGIAPATYLVYEIVFQCETLFHHSNLRLPLRMERWLNIVIVTPRMHGIHHSVVAGETNSNYSVIFRWWDHLHRTLRLNVAQGGVDIGVAAYQLGGDNRLWNLLAMPFRRQRRYWRLASGGFPQSSRVESAKTATLVE